MNETLFEQETALLLERVSEVVKDFDKQDRETGAKYNIFTIAGVSEKEVIICRVITDLLDPKGRHGKGDVYLKLFWDMVSQKIKDRPALDTKTARVTREHSTDVNRRIDIVIEDKDIFVPIEVKIRAGEQKAQIADYAEYAERKNRGRNIPVIYLTIDGSKPKTAGGAYVVCISFKDDILSWLKKCLSQNETEHTPPVCEVIKQLVSAVKSFCGYLEDKAMEKIAELITQSEESIRAAAAIKGVLENSDNESWELFKGSILEKVKKERSEARFDEEKAEDGINWKGIYVPLLSGQYDLYIRNDWKTMLIGVEKGAANPAIEEKLVKEMSNITGRYNEKAGENWKDYVWATTKARYPGMENVEDAHYGYELYRQFVRNPDAAAQQIMSIVQALENAGKE
ncbi:hypothetical protein AGMMS49546_36660 [Spirochaetia bacterium]|nr:hypothetical protein AGMMS49546_36660 [Spirochaetia bacterium]